MRAPPLAFALVLGSALLGACATVRVVKSQPGKGGVIALQPGMFGDAKEKAMTTAKGNCGAKKVKVTEEGEAKIGSKSAGSTKGGNKSGDSTNESESVDKVEWRMSYKCSKK